MKVGFFLQRRFAYVGHEMAKILKEKYGVTRFCGYVALRESLQFLKAQDDIKYEGLLLDDDIYAKYADEPLDKTFIDAFEKKYGMPTLWPYIYLDRVIRYNLLVREYPYDTPRYSHEDMLRIVQVAGKEIERFLDEQKPDVLFFSVISNIGSFLLYAKKKGIRTFILDAARVGNNYFLTEEFNRSTFVREVFARVQENPEHYSEDVTKAKAFLEKFQTTTTYYLESSMGFATMNRSSNKGFAFTLLSLTRLKNIAWWLWFATEQYIKYRADYVTPNPLLAFWDKARRHVRLWRGYNDLYDAPQSGEKYVFVPLHSEPEAYPMLLAPYYTDQLWLVKQIARSIPATHKLYVKDHPGMVGFRTRHYYKELKKIPNVRLIPAAHKSLDLIKNSELVITLLGTAGWEAALLKKPVIIFGDN